MSTILVTGGSGFIGSHCILQLLAAGHQVRTTVRSLKRERDVRAMLKEGGADQSHENGHAGRGTLIYDDHHENPKYGEAACD